MTLQADHASLKDQLDWFKRQLFGRHSEKRLEYDLPEHASLFARNRNQWATSREYVDRRLPDRVAKTCSCALTRARPLEKLEAPKSEKYLGL